MRLATLAIRGKAMDWQQIWQIAKRSPAALVGVLAGAVLMYGANQFPVLIEATWGEEESHIKFDSRMERWCEVAEVHTD